MVGLEGEFGQEGADLRGFRVGDGGAEGVEQRLGAVEELAGLVDLAEQDTGAEGRVPGVEGDPAEEGAQERGLARAVGPGDRHPVRPVDLEGDRAEHEVAAPDLGVAQGGDDRARAGRRRDLHAQFPLLARFLDDLQAFDHALGLAGLGGLLLAGLAAELAAGLVVVVGRLAPGVADALVHPGALHLRPVLEGGALVGVLLVVVPGVAAGHRAFLEVRLVAAAVEVDLPLGQVEFEDLGDGAGEELAVVADDDGAGAQAGHEAFEAVQAVEVEVVGRLVEEEDVVAGEEEGGETGAGGLAAGERGHRLVQADGEAQCLGGLPRPVVEVGAAQGEPALQGRRVGVVGSGGAVDEGLGGLVHGPLGLGDAGTAGQELPDALAGAALRLLREVADGGGGRGQAQLAPFRCGQPGEHPQEGGLARAVGPHETDHVAGCDDEVEPGEQGAVAVAGGEVFGDEGGSHQTVDPSRGRMPPGRAPPRTGAARHPRAGPSANVLVWKPNWMAN